MKNSINKQFYWQFIGVKMKYLKPLFFFRVKPDQNHLYHYINYVLYCWLLEPDWPKGADLFSVTVAQLPITGFI